MSQHFIIEISTVVIALMIGGAILWLAWLEVKRARERVQ